MELFLELIKIECRHYVLTLNLFAHDGRTDYIFKRYDKRDWSTVHSPVEMEFFSDYEDACDKLFYSARWFAGCDCNSTED